MYKKLQFWANWSLCGYLKQKKKKKKKKKKNKKRKKGMYYLKTNSNCHGSVWEEKLFLYLSKFFYLV